MNFNDETEKENCKQAAEEVHQTSLDTCELEECKVEKRDEMQPKRDDCMKKEKA